MTRKRSPTSKGFFVARVSPIDAAWALLAPLVALYLTNAGVLTAGSVQDIALYCGVAFAASVFSFVVFRLQDGLSQYFSVHDALAVIKAVVMAGLITGAAVFTLNRLDGIPRSAPIVHALLLAAGLIFWRLIVRMRYRERNERASAAEEHILMIGATPLAVRYIQLLEAYAPAQLRVVAILDDQPGRVGRSLAGVRVIGPSSQIAATIEEYAVHGVPIDRVIVGGEPDILSGEALHVVREACESRGIALEFVPRLVGLRQPETKAVTAVEEPAAESVSPARYHRTKRVIDLVVAAALLTVFAPLFLLVSLVALIDVGSPVFFWQQRIGRGGRTFLLYKVRTLRAPFDPRGRRIPDDRRLSYLGKLLRRTRLDEFPQLFNIIVGDMSLIGPRPLLPQDQPKDAAVRLMIRPGITGWAQVNGGVSLTPEEKRALDELYVRGASPVFDLVVVLKTILFLFRRELAVQAAPAKRAKPSVVVKAQPVGARATRRESPDAA